MCERGPPLLLLLETERGVAISRLGIGKFEVVPWTQTFTVVGHSFIQRFI